MKLPPSFAPSPQQPDLPVKEDFDSALDEALKESFPASDPIAVSIESRKPREAILPDTGQRRDSCTE